MRTWKKIVAATMVAMMMVSNVQPVVTVRAAEEVCEEATIESTTELQTESTQEDATMEETTDESSTEEEPTVEVTTEEEATEDNSTTEVTNEEVITEEGSTEEVSTEEVTTEDIPTEEDTEESELREREYGVVYGSDGLPVMIEMTPELAEALNDQEQQDIANGFVTKEESKNFEAHRVTRNSQVGEKMSLRFMNRFGINKLYVEGIYNGRAITSEEAEMMYVEQGGTARTVFCLEFGVTASKGDTLEMQDGMQLFKKLDDTQKDNVKHAIGLAQNAYLNPNTCTYNEWRNLNTTQYLVWYYSGQMTIDQAYRNCGKYGNWDEFCRVKTLTEQYKKVPEFPNKNNKLTYNKTSNRYEATLTDSNNQLQYIDPNSIVKQTYDGKSTDDIQVTITGNTLKVSVPISHFTYENKPLKIGMTKKTEFTRVADINFLKNSSKTGSKVNQQCCYVSSIQSDPVGTKVSFYADNTAPFMINFLKRDGNTGKYINGVTFGLYAAEDIKDEAGNVIFKKDLTNAIAAQASGQADCFGKFKQNGMVYFTAGQKANGGISYLYPGTYVIKELSTKKGYRKLTDTENSITIRVTKEQVVSSIKNGSCSYTFPNIYKADLKKNAVANTYKTTIFDVPNNWVNNQPQYTEIVVHKTDKDTGEDIKDVTFALYANSDIVYPDSNNTLVWKKGTLLSTIVTNAKGNATFSDAEIGQDLINKRLVPNHGGKCYLLPGSYKIKETAWPSNYGTPNTVWHFITVKADGSTTATIKKTVEITNETYHGSFDVCKLDKTTGLRIPGVVFGLYAAENIKVGGEVVFKKDTLIAKEKTDASGRAFFTRGTSASDTIHFQNSQRYYLLSGRYYVKELSAPDGVIVDTNWKQEITIENEDGTGLNLGHIVNAENHRYADIEAWDERQSLEIKVEKEDAESKLPLADVTFELYAAEDITVASAKEEVDPSGQGIIYEPDEVIVWKKGQKLGTKTTKMDRNGKATATFSSAKAYWASYYGNLATPHVVSEEEYKAFLKGEEFTYSNVERKDMTLLPGDYYLVETVTRNGYVLSEERYDVVLTGDQTNNTISTKLKTIQNTAMKFNLELQKVDDENQIVDNEKLRTEYGVTLDGATYGLYPAEVIKDVQNGTTLYEADPECLNDPIATLVTDGEGKASLENVRYGKYKLKELEAPKTRDAKEHPERYKDGDPAQYLYEVSTEITDVDCTPDSGTNQLVYNRNVTVEEHAKKQPVEIRKYYQDDNGTNIPLGGVGFSFYSVYDLLDAGVEIPYQNGIYDVTTLKEEDFNKVNPLTITCDGKTMITTDENGYAKTADLYYGLYVMREVVYPDYVVPMNPMYIVLPQKNEDGTIPAVCTVEVINYSTVVEISKQAITTGEELVGAELELYNSENQCIAAWTTDGKPYKLHNLSPGEYRLKEKRAPYGFMIAEEVMFHVTQSKEIQKVVMKDKECFSELEILKVDQDTNKPIAGVEFELYADEDISFPAKSVGVVFKKNTMIAKGVTDTEGKLIFKTGFTDNAAFHNDGMCNLLAGNYYIKETKADNYHLLETPVKVTLTVDDKERTRTVITVKNKRIKRYGSIKARYTTNMKYGSYGSPDSPKTGDGTPIALMISLLVLSAGMIVARVMQRKRKSIAGIMMLSVLLVVAMMGQVVTFAHERTGIIEELSSTDNLNTYVNGKKYAFVQTKTYTTYNAEEPYEFAEEISQDNHSYKLKEVVYSIEKEEQEVPEITYKIETEELSETVKKENLTEQQKDELPDTINKNGITYHLDGIEYQEKDQKEHVSCWVETEYVTEKPTRYESSRATEYTSALTKETKEYHLPFEKIEVVEDYAWKDDVIIPVTIESYDADFYKIGNTVIPYNEERPAFDEESRQQILDMVGLNREQYQICDVVWDGAAYEEQGVMCRNAIATGKRYAAKYRIWYSDTITTGRLYDATLTYKGVIEKKVPVEQEIASKETKTVYTVKAQGLYQKNITVVTYLSAFVGVLIAIAMLLALLLMLKQKKKRNVKARGLDIYQVNNDISKAYTDTIQMKQDVHGEQE